VDAKGSPHSFKKRKDATRTGHKNYWKKKWNRTGGESFRMTRFEKKMVLKITVLREPKPCK
jgi:hypothetical protein